MDRVLGDRRTVLALLGPALIVYTAVMLVPVLVSLGYTFFSGNAISGFTFTGLDNIKMLWQDQAVRDALVFTLKYAVVITVGQVALGYGLSLLYVFVLRKASALVRTLLFFPVVLPTVAVALLFQNLFQIAPQNGLVNSALNTIGVESIDWFGSSGMAFLVIVLMDLWRSAGFYGVLLYTGMVDVPEDLMEAAKLDGASTWSLIRHLVFPLTLPVLLSSTPSSR